jgi:hypothetical protein
MSFIRTIKTFLFSACMPLYFGDGGDSQANTNTTTSTNTSSVNTDQSMMGGDDEVGLNGSGNVVDKSVVNNTAFNDSSNRSTNFLDASNKSTNFSDSSNHSTYFSDSSVRNDSSNRSTNYSTTDFGAVSAALSGMGKLSSQALDTSGMMVRDGLSAVRAQSSDNISVLSKAFEFAGASSAADAAKYTDVLGFAKEAISSTSAAYADAKDGGTNKTLTIAAVAVIGAVGLAAAFGRI